MSSKDVQNKPQIEGQICILGLNDASKVLAQALIEKNKHLHDKIFIFDPKDDLFDSKTLNDLSNIKNHFNNDNKSDYTTENVQNRQPLKISSFKIVIFMTKHNELKLKFFPSEYQ